MPMAFEGMVAALIAAIVFLILSLFALQSGRNRLFFVMLALCVFCIAVFISGGIDRVSKAGKKLDEQLQARD